MSTSYVVNPNILKRCRMQIGIDSIEESIKITGCKRLEQYESGDASPTIKQLEKIADCYSVPSWVFFHNELPDEYNFSGNKYPEFRTLEGTQGNLNYQLKKIIHTFGEFRENLLDIIEDDEAATAEIFQGPSISKGISKGISTKDIHSIAETTRKWLGYSDEVLPKRATRTKALAYWKGLIEDKGILVFTTSSHNHWSKVSTESMRGMAIYNKIFPIIIINGSDALSANLFTLMHELGHILLGQTNLVKGDNHWKANISNSEKLCNEFAAEVLMPDDKFMTMLKDYRNQGLATAKIIDNLSKDFMLSAIAVAIKMKIKGEIRSADFDDIKSQLVNASINFTGRVPRNRPSEIVNFYGKPYIRAVLQLYYDGEITLNKLLNALNIKKLAYLPYIEVLV